MKFNWKFTIYFVNVLFVSEGTTDINLAEYQYIADRLTERECLKLVAALHFRNFAMPREIKAAEQKLPKNMPCIDLLLHWNSTPREGRGKNYVEVSHRLNQIGREDLAQWLSKTVFHQLSIDLLSIFNKFEEITTTTGPPVATEFFVEKKLDEAAWWKLDTALLILIIFGTVTLIYGIFVFFYLSISNQMSFTKCDYTKLSVTDDKGLT